MEAHSAIPYLREALIFLAIAGIAVPLLSRVKVSPVLGYLLVGGLIGPFGLGLLAADYPVLGQLVIADLDGVRALAEIGVVFLMFMIGLELSLDRLWSARALVFGMGSLQIIVSAAAIAWIAAALGADTRSALIVGAAFSLSSTAIVMQLLMRGRRQSTPVGRAGFAILLMQDLAVVPILFMVGVLATPDGPGLATGLALALAKAALVIVGIYVAGRVLIRPVLRQVAQARSAEMFTAAVLLTAVGVAALTANFGLSMALGALLAGLLLAETEYRHQIEVDIEPFKGLLLGLFFMSVGMGIDWRNVVSNPLVIAATVAGLWLLKAVIIAALARAFGQRRSVAVEAGLLLGQGGEFAFIILAAATGLGLIASDLEQHILIVAGVSMLLTPLVAQLAQRAGHYLEHRDAAHAAPDSDDSFRDCAGHVIIAGFGRVGQTLARALDAEGLDYVALDADAAMIAKLRDRQQPVFYGDASRVEILAKAGILQAAAVVVTMNDPAAASRIVAEIHRRWPMVPIHARASDPAHARRLLELGATYCTPETVEASLQLASNVLLHAGMDADVVQRRVAEQRLVETNRV
ncbi:cation:proton antiporter [Novosphingobium sp.]|uniref:cation:proton antiporter domain-containing protein n=1 Tax=Novosphingobium sp. TaxID=1874826 RepID=UPI00273369D2|nr:cation:proton antiporter [Novosphingobium sp.]MDP3906541.1 cation:proton antiporter [Novosphingobium sp.]